MNKNELKRLRRQDLLEMLLELTKENEQLRERNAELEMQLQNRILTVENAGSLAEAALQLNAVFQAAQDACDQYTYNVQLRCQRIEETKAKFVQMIGECKRQLERYEKEDYD